MCRFPVFALRNSRMIPEYTLERVYHVLAWSFKVSSRKLGAPRVQYIILCVPLLKSQFVWALQRFKQDIKVRLWGAEVTFAVHHLPHVQGSIWWYTSQPWLWRQSTAITTCQVEWQTNCRWWWFFFCSFLFVWGHQQSAQSSLACHIPCHIQLAGGSACLVEHRGDWKWLREAYGLKAHWSAGTYICHLCNAKSAKNPCRWSRILGLYFNQIYVGTP